MNAINFGLGSFKVFVEPAGTVIEHEGRRLTVDDHNAIQKGDAIYVTQPNYDALMRHVGEKA